MKGQGNWIPINPSLYSNIDQGAVLVNRKEDHKQDSQGFYDFLFSDEAKEILKEFGYLVDE